MDPSQAAPSALAPPDTALAVVLPSQVWPALTADQQQRVLKTITLVCQDLLQASPQEVPHD